MRVHHLLPLIPVVVMVLEHHPVVRILTYILFTKQWKTTKSTSSSSATTTAAAAAAVAAVKFSWRNIF